MGLRPSPVTVRETVFCSLGFTSHNSAGDPKIYVSRLIFWSYWAFPFGYSVFTLTTSSFYYSLYIAFFFFPFLAVITPLRLKNLPVPLSVLDIVLDALQILFHLIFLRVQLHLLIKKPRLRETNQFTFEVQSIN